MPRTLRGAVNHFCGTTLPTARFPKDISAQRAWPRPTAAAGDCKLARAVAEIAAIAMAATEGSGGGEIRPTPESYSPEDTKGTLSCCGGLSRKFPPNTKERTKKGRTRGQESGMTASLEKGRRCRTFREISRGGGGYAAAFWNSIPREADLQPRPTAPTPLREEAHRDRPRRHGDDGVADCPAGDPERR